MQSPGLRAFFGDAAIVGGVVRAGVGVLARGGEIVCVGDQAAVTAAAAGQPIDWVRRPRMLLSPGTVNAHNHSFQSLLRGIADDRPFLEWRDQALYKYAPRLGVRGVETGALLAFGEMLLHGVTTVCDFFYIQDGGNDNARAVIAAARALGMRVVLG